MGQTVNLLVYTFGGSNPSSPTDFLKNPSSNLSDDKRFLKFILKEDKADEEGEREFTSVNDLPTTEVQRGNLSKETKKAEVAQLVEH